MTNARTAYKELTRKRKHEYDRKNTEKLEKIRRTNAKDYWKLF